MHKETRGRKTVKDKKVSLTITVKTSTIKGNGGPKKARVKAVEYLDSQSTITLK